MTQIDYIYIYIYVCMYANIFNGYVAHASHLHPSPPTLTKFKLVNIPLWLSIDNLLSYTSRMYNER